MRQSRAETLVTEEPDALIAHVRVCGGAGWVTTGSTRKVTGKSVRSCVGWPLPWCFHVYGYRPLNRHTGDPCHKAGLRVEHPIARICVRLTPLPQVFRPSASFTGHEYLDCLSGTSGSCGMLTDAGVSNAAS
jgi:hypothetical protein